MLTIQLSNNNLCQLMTKKNITRRELFNKINQKLGFSKNLSSTIIDDFFELLTSELIEKNKVKISSFGTFQVVNKKERVGRNPKNKKEAIITARRIVKFKPSMIVKKKINK